MLRTQLGPQLKPVLRSAIRSARRSGSASLDIRASVGTSTSPTSTGTKVVTGVGFQPKVVLPFSIFEVETPTATDASLSFGAATSSSNRTCVAVSSRHSTTTTETHRRHDNSKIHYPVYRGTNPFEIADLSSMDADGFTYNYSTKDGFERAIRHIALGGADLEVSLVQCQMNGTNVAQSFTHGLSGAPTGVLFLSGIQSTAPANTATHLFASIGAWAGSNQFSAGIYSLSGQTTTQTRRYLATNSTVAYIESNPMRTLGVSSVDATNVNVTYPVTTSAAQFYFWMLCIRGAKCQVGTFDCNGSTSPLTIATTGITPKLFLPVFVKDGVDSVGTVLNDLGLTIGASDGTNSVSCGIGDINGATTTNARRWQDSAKFCERNPSNGNSIFEATAAFSGESVVLTPTLNSFSNWGQGAYLCVGS